MQFTQIKETCLYIDDVERTESFYHSLLGLEVINKVSGEHIFLRVGTSVLLCFVHDTVPEKGVLPWHEAKGKIHFAIESANGEYQSIREKISALGIEILHEHNWPGGRKSFYFRDPDQHLVEIVEPGLWD